MSHVRLSKPSIQTRGQVIEYLSIDEEDEDCFANISSSLEEEGIEIEIDDIAVIAIDYHRHGGHIGIAFRAELFVHAIQEEAFDVADALIAEGHDVNEEFEDWHPLQSAGTPKAVSYLVKNGIDINHQDQNGYTALHHAQTVDIAIALMEHGADTRIRSFTDEETPYEYHKNYSEVHYSWRDDSVSTAIQLWESKRLNAAIAESLKNSWSSDTVDGKRFLLKLSASAPSDESVAQQARRKM